MADSAGLGGPYSASFVGSTDPAWPTAQRDEYLPRNDFGEVEARHLKQTPGTLNVGPLKGQLWRSLKASAKEADYRERHSPFFNASEGWSAFRLAAIVSAASASRSEPGQSFWQSA